MCGIVGLFGLRGSAAPHRERWPELVNHLHHRGPDEGGFWAEGPFFLGNRRLSIIDIDGGHQPMAAEDGSLVVTFNGEIYNHVELRAELENLGARFATRSDTEVLLAGYRAWGAGLPARLSGMFAFAVADRRKGELFLARDRFGEKPLLWTKTSRYFAFASELRPLAALPDIERRMDPAALGLYLTLNYAPGASTLLEGVRRLPPASWMHVGPRGERSGTYWSPAPAPEADSGTPDAEAAGEFSRRLDAAVRLNLRSDVPVGIFLSGGIDSTLIAESAARTGRLNRAYCVDFEEDSYSEFGAAREVAERLEIPLERVPLACPTPEDFLKIAGHADDPMADSSAWAVYAVSRHAAGRGNKVVLGGDGGDELFGGYLTYAATSLHRRLFMPLPRGARRALAALGESLPVTDKKVSFSYKLWRFLRAAALDSRTAHATWNGTWLPETALSFFADDGARRSAEAALASFARGLAPESADGLGLFDLQKQDIALYLADDILVKTDRMSMASGLETRAPFLEHGFAGWALTRPDRFKIGPGGELKALARRVVRGKFGARHAARPKRGFSIPVHRWVRGPLAPLVRELVSENSLKALGMLDALKVGEKADAHFAGRRQYGFELWGLAMLAAWHRSRVARPPAPPPPYPLVERAFALKTA